MGKLVEIGESHLPRHLVDIEVTLLIQMNAPGFSADIAKYVGQHIINGDKPFHATKFVQTNGSAHTMFPKKIEHLIHLFSQWHYHGRMHDVFRMQTTQLDAISHQIKNIFGMYKTHQVISVATKYRYPRMSVGANMFNHFFHTHLHIKKACLGPRRHDLYNFRLVCLE